MLGKPISFNYKKFYSAVGISSKNFNALDLSYLKSSHIQIEETDLKYCPICMEYFYHSIFFQLKWLKTCPIHKVALVNTCSKCNTKLTNHISAKNIQKPYCCPSCQQKLIDTTTKDLLHLKTLDGFETFDEINVWCKYVLTLPEKYGLFKKYQHAIPSEWFYPLYKSFSDRPVPQILEANSLYIDAVENKFNSGLPSTSSKFDESRLLEGLLSGEEPIPNLAPIFKSYRRYLIKKEIGNWGKAKLKHDYGNWIGEVDLSERYIKLYSLLIYTDTLHRWGGNVQSQYSKRYLYMGFNFYDAYGALKLCRNSQEAEWVILHAYFEELRSLFQETLVSAKRMIETKSMWVYWPLRAIHLPCSFVSRNQENNKLVFTSHQKACVFKDSISSNPYVYVEQCNELNS